MEWTDEIDECEIELARKRNKIKREIRKKTNPLSVRELCCLKCINIKWGKIKLVKNGTLEQDKEERREKKRVVTEMKEMKE